MLALSKIKAIADDNFRTTQMVQFVFDMVETIVGERENTDYLHFLILRQYFLKASFQGPFIVG